MLFILKYESYLYSKPKGDITTAMVERLLSAQGLMKPRVFLKSASTDSSSNSGVFDDDPDAPAETPDPTDPPTVAPGLVQFFTQ